MRSNIEIDRRGEAAFLVRGPLGGVMVVSAVLALLAFVAVAIPVVARADDPPAQAAAPPATPPAAEKKKDGNEPASREEVKALAEELRRLKLQIGLGETEVKSFGGMGPAASKVYFAPKGLSIGGYGEVTYANLLDVEGEDQSDLYRIVLYAGYRFSDRIVFNSEIEFEHAGHEVGVEFAYLDFLLSSALRVRAGNVLVPVGIVNRIHEPPFFHGVFRPDVERRLIPSTWNENGLGVHGERGGLRYQAYLLNGLDVRASADEPLRAQDWLRRARTGGGESAAETFAGVAALEYALGPVTVGGSYYRGRAGQGAKAAGGETIHADVTLAEGHALLAWRGLAARGLLVEGRLGDADLVSAALGLSGTAVLGSRVRGGYAEVAYDLLSLLAPGGEQSLWPFARWEAIDLHDRVPAGGVRDPALDQRIWTAGLTYKPLPTVAIKGDFQRRTDAAPGSDPADQVDLGIGFVF